MHFDNKTNDWFEIQGIIAFVCLVVICFKKNDLLVKPLQIEEAISTITVLSFLKPTLKIYLPNSFTLFLIILFTIVFMFSNKDISKYIKTKILTKFSSDNFENNLVLPFSNDAASNYTVQVHPPLPSPSSSQYSTPRWCGTSPPPPPSNSPTNNLQFQSNCWIINI